MNNQSNYYSINNEVQTVDHSSSAKQRREVQQNWELGRWLRQHGLTVKQFDHHPCINDLVTLISIRQSFWGGMNKSEQAVWGAYWGLVYKNQKQLTGKFWKKFDTITKNIDQRQQTLAQQRQTIRTLKNIGHDMTAKGPCLPQTELTQVDQQECRADPNYVPWH